LRQRLLDLLRELHRPVVGIVVADKTAGKADEDIRGWGRGPN